MSYFRNKFNKEFLFLCQRQEPKGGSVRLDDKDHTFWVFRKRYTGNQPKTIQVIPLLLFNKIKSTNKQDINVEDYMMLCKNKSDTEVTCSYDPNYVAEDGEDYVCDFGITAVTGDLSGDEY